MDVLSTAAGSAQAVRDAAAASQIDIDHRLALERELDRLNVALSDQATAAAQHLNWTLLAQAFLLTAYLIVLVPGWSTPLPGKRWLLGAIAAYGVVSLVLGYLAQRGSRDRIAPLRQSRKLTERALERVANRPAVFSRERLVVTVLGAWSTRLIPVVLLAGWVGLSMYTLALPLPSDVRVTAESRADMRASNPGAGQAQARGRATPRKGEEAPPPAAASDTASAEGESGLGALFRRALNAPAAETADTVKP